MVRRADGGQSWKSLIRSDREARALAGRVIPLACPMKG